MTRFVEHLTNERGMLLKKLKLLNDIIEVYQDKSWPRTREQYEWKMSDKAEIIDQRLRGESYADISKTIGKTEIQVRGMINNERKRIAAYYDILNSL